MLGKPSIIYVVSADGGNPRQVTTGPRNDVDSSWSPDGHSLIFAGNSGFGDAPPNILTIDRVDLRTNTVSTLPGSEGLQSPKWSPSGRYVVANTADWQKLMLFDFTTQKWVELFAGRGLSRRHWSRDEEYVYFYNLSGEGPSIQLVRIRDRKVERVVLGEVGRIGVGNLGGVWFGLSQDDFPIMLRDVGTQEIYALDVDFSVENRCQVPGSRKSMSQPRLLPQVYSRSRGFLRKDASSFVFPQSSSKADPRRAGVKWL